MSYRPGKLYVCPIINTMGPVVDSRHADLLNTWADVDQGCDKIFSEDYRSRYPDSDGRGAVFSWFVISWSGFRSNPVQRDFGYFNVLDHYVERYAEKMRRHGDDIYWMYNHPPASGVGNEWGMDWGQNAQYLEILMRFVAERSWFPSVVQVPTEAQHTSHFLENFFPFDLSNRNAVDIQWDAKNADGKTMAQVIDWRRAPHNWDAYRPSAGDYQVAGQMKRHVGRLLDIQSIVYVLDEQEIEKAFQRCLEGHDVMLSAYEHDFRDRADVIEKRLLEPVHRLARRYPEVNWSYANSLHAFQRITGQSDFETPSFQVVREGHGNLLVSGQGDVFGYAPFTFFVSPGGDYHYSAPLKVGDNKWLIYRNAVVPDGRLFIAALSPSGRQAVQSFSVDEIAESPLA